MYIKTLGYITFCGFSMFPLLPSCQTLGCTLLSIFVITTRRFWRILANPCIAKKLIIQLGR